MTIRAVHVIPLVMMIFKEAKSMNTIFIAIVVRLVLCPTPKFGCALVAPHKIPFRVDIIEPQPGVLHHADFGQKRFLPGYVCWEGQLTLSHMLYCCCPSYRMQPLDCSKSYRNSTSRLYKYCL